jgi:hypothetical protein
LALRLITQNTIITLVMGDVELLHDGFRDSVDEADSKTIELSHKIIVSRLIGDMVVFIPILTLNSSFASSNRLSFHREKHVHRIVNMCVDSMHS